MVQQVTPDFDGETYERQHDHQRLSRQLQLVRDVLLADALWWTLPEIARHIETYYGIQVPQQSLSARVRDLRKPKFGGYLVERRARGSRADGLFEYRVRRAEHNEPERVPRKNSLVPRLVAYRAALIAIRQPVPFGALTAQELHKELVTRIQIAEKALSDK